MWGALPMCRCFLIDNFDGFGKSRFLGSELKMLGCLQVKNPEPVSSGKQTPTAGLHFTQKYRHGVAD